MRVRRLRLILLLLAPLALIVALLAGSQPISPATLLKVLTGSEHGLAETLVMQIRLPRALSAFAVGGLLALAGALLQALTRNPLADPYILGVSGGASVAALTALLLGLTGIAVSASALVGSLAAMLLVFALSHGHGTWTETRLLLTGVVVATGCGAAVSLLLALSPQSSLASMLFWLLGDLDGARAPASALIVLGGGLLATVPFARSLNLYARGETVAAALGENVRALRYGIFLLASLLTAAAVTLAGAIGFIGLVVPHLLASLLTAAAVTLAGAIGFIGLVVPHLLRLLGATDHRRLLPDAVLAGGILLTLADTLARTVVAPTQLPVGVITALIGVPLFLVLLARGSRAGL